ncbi:hypothetical protein RYX36_006710 [Vicia faba]
MVPFRLLRALNDVASSPCSLLSLNIVRYRLHCTGDRGVYGSIAKCDEDVKVYGSIAKCDEDEGSSLINDENCEEVRVKVEDEDCREVKEDEDCREVKEDEDCREVKEDEDCREVKEDEDH